MSGYADKWYVVREGSVGHGYDGWVLHIQERNIVSLLFETLWERLMHDVLGLCCPDRRLSRLIERFEKPMNKGYTEFRIVNWGFQQVWKRWRGLRMDVPVPDWWVADNFPDSYLEMEVNYSSSRIAGHGTLCPSCGHHRVNWTEHIASHGMCTICRMRLEEYGGIV